MRGGGAGDSARLLDIMALFVCLFVAWVVPPAISVWDHGDYVSQDLSDSKSQARSWLKINIQGYAGMGNCEDHNPQWD